MRSHWLVALALASCTNPQPPRAPDQIVSSGGPTVSKVSPDASPFIDAWATAVGGRPALSRITAVHGKGTYERGGVRGTIDVWETASGQRREDIVQGPIHELRVFDGTRGWLVDRNGEVRELAGFELDDQVTLAYLGSFSALLTDRRPGTVSVDAGKLVLAPDGSKRPATVTLDPGTHLPESYARREAERMRTVRLSDWNTVSGVKLPWSINEDNGNPNDSVVVHFKTLEAGTPPSDAFAQPMGRELDATLASDPVVVPIEIVFGGLIFVKVSVNDVPMSFVFDTGAEATVLNSSRVSKLGLQGVGTFATGAGGGDVVVSYVPGVTTKVGGATVKNQLVAAILLDDLEKALQRPFDGILGYDFISRFVVEIDYANQQMRLFDRTKYHHTGAGKPIAVSLEDSTPYVDATVEVPQRGQLAGHFVVDTGCLCDVQLFTPFVDDNKLIEALPDAKQTGFSAGAGGATQEVSTTLPSVTIGDVVVKQVRADLNRDKAGATADPESAGLLGSLTFKRFVLVLDYRNKQVFLDPLH
jgi:predicted aspartyl protease